MKVSGTVCFTSPYRWFDRCRNNGMMIFSRLLSLPQSSSKTLYVLLAILKLVHIVYVEMCAMLKKKFFVKHVDSLFAKWRVVWLFLRKTGKRKTQYKEFQSKVSLTDMPSWKWESWTSYWLQSFLSLTLL